MSNLRAGIFAAAFSWGALAAGAVTADLNPPKVSATKGDSVTLRQVLGYEARCFKESTIRTYGEWTNPKKSISAYLIKVELRNGVEYLTIMFQLGTHSVKLLMEMDDKGSIRNAPPLVETTLPDFEKEYGPMLNKLVAGMSGEFLGRTFEVGKDYGPYMNFCNVTGAQSNGAPEGAMVVDGTLTHSGRSAFLISQTYEQVCSENGVRFSVKGSAWTVYDLMSGLAMSSSGRFELFSQGTRFRQSDESVECVITEKK